MKRKQQHSEKPTQKKAGAHTSMLFYSLSHTHTCHTHKHTPAPVCVCVWWGVMINSDLKPDMVGVVGVGVGSKGKGLQ